MRSNVSFVAVIVFQAQQEVLELQQQQVETDQRSAAPLQVGSDLRFKQN